MERHFAVRAKAIADLGLPAAVRCARHLAPRNSATRNLRGPEEPLEKLTYPVETVEPSKIDQADLRAFKLYAFSIGLRVLRDHCAEIR